MPSLRCVFRAGSVGLLVIVAAADRASAQIVRQLSHDASTYNQSISMDSAGAAVYVATNTAQFNDNPSVRMQIARFDAASGSGQFLAPYSPGISFEASVSDDGQWVVFTASQDLTGTNHDQSLEAFVMRADGTQLRQLTNDPAVNAGSVFRARISGDASTVVFESDTNPLGTNPGHEDQLFAIHRDGTGLAQLTSIPETANLYFSGFDVSDDGQRVVFAVDANLTGGNPDLGSEVFAVLSSGTSLRQLTSSNAESVQPAISGNGARIAFQSRGNLTGHNTLQNNEIFVLNWDGTGMTQLTTSSTDFRDPRESDDPRISDDGTTIVFSSNQVHTPSTNVDGNFEIWKIQSNGTGLTLLTNTASPSRASEPAIAGGGGRVAFFFQGIFPGGIDTAGASEIFVMDSAGGNVHRLTQTHYGYTLEPDITPDGSRIVFISEGNLTGQDPGHIGALYRVEADGSGLAQVGSTANGEPDHPSIAADRTTIVFSSTGNPLGSNADGSAEIFLVHADGSGLKQLTSGPGASTVPSIARGGSKIVFVSNGNLTGGNADLSDEIFVVNSDGSGMRQLTSSVSTPKHSSSGPRIDDSGTWVAFATDANLDGGAAEAGTEVYRVRTDGTGLQRLSNSPSGLHSALTPDISGSGSRVVYESDEDPLGTNPDNNSEIFLYDLATGTTRQLTSTIEGENSTPGISRDGAWVYFHSTSPFTEDRPGYSDDLYRVEVATGAVRRMGALHLQENFFDYRFPITVDQDGGRAAFGGYGDFAGENPPDDYQAFLVDLTIPTSIHVSGRAPTVVSWPPEASPIRYDVIRGDLANLHVAGSTIDLGPVVCLEDDSPDANTAGFEDASDPAPGHGYFYLYRGSEGLNLGPGSFGSSNDGKERVGGAGVCSP